ncbi:MAG: 50S ribosomal protein L18 [Bacteroidia bacterium]|nr:50S ribosomal protein L18 [Bacteroidia bacterium]
MGITREFRRERIKKRIRKVVSGDSATPRLTVFRSNKQIYAQLVDDLSGKTLVAAGSVSKENKNFKGNKTDQAKSIGKAIAEKAIAKGITSVRFDRNGYLYHGRVKALADAAREAGLKF